MLKKVKIFSIVVLLSTSTLFAAHYDDDILSMYAKLSPRIILMSTLKEKREQKLEICLLHQKIDEQAALALQEKIINNYQTKIQSYDFEIKRTLYEREEECINSSLLFLFAGSVSQVKKSVAFSKEKKILTLSYDAKLLENGVDISLFIGRKVTPYINVGSIQSKGITMDNMLLRVSKIYREAEQ